MTRYWTMWLLIGLVTFAVPEFVALARRKPQNTLSWWVWDHFQVVRHQPISQWSASHVLFAGTFVVIAAWLTAHLVLRIWT